VVIAIIGLLAAILFPVFSRARENARRATCQTNLKELGLAFTQYAQDYDERLPFAFSNNPDTSWDQCLESYLGQQTKSTNANPYILRCPSDSFLRTFGSCGSVGPQEREIRSYSQPATGTTGIYIGGNRRRNSDNSLCSSGPACTSDYYNEGRLVTEIPSAVGTIMLAENPGTRNRFRLASGAVVGSASAQGSQYTCSNPPVIDPIHFDSWNYLFVDGHVKALHPEATVGMAYGGTLASPKGMWTIYEND
jgi:type II secretory pathway pseudopilin PulG